MLKRLPISVLGLSLACFGLVACGGGGSDEGGNEEVDTSTGDTTGDSTSESGTDTGTTDPTTDTGTTDPTTDTGTTGGACQVWQITYDLSDSEFEISGTPLGAGDQVNVVVEDDQADDEIGPGTMVLYFEDMGGTPGGMAWIASYDMDSNFVVASAGATVSSGGKLELSQAQAAMSGVQVQVKADGSLMLNGVLVVGSQHIPGFVEGQFKDGRFEGVSRFPSVKCGYKWSLQKSQ